MQVKYIDDAVPKLLIRNWHKLVEMRFMKLWYYYLLITKAPTNHLQRYTKTQKYNKTQWHTMTHKKSVGPK